LAKNKFYVFVDLNVHTQYLTSLQNSFAVCEKQTMHVTVGHDLGRFTPIFIILSLSDSKKIAQVLPVYKEFLFYI